MSRAALLAALLLAAPAASAQWYGGVTVTGGVPAGSFSDQLDAVALGASASALYHLQRVPVAVGLEGSILTYGHRRRAFSFPGAPEVGLDVVTDNNIAQGLVVLRVQPDWGPVRLYAEAVAGVNYLFTESRIEDYDYDETLASDTHYDDFAPTGGGGVGALVEVYRDLKPGRDGGPSEVLVDLRVRYLFGAEASYLAEGDLQGRSGRLVALPRRSRTDLLLPQIGVAVRF